MLNVADKCRVRSGQATLEVALVLGESTITAASASSPMKVLTPISRGRSAWAYTSSFGGGMVAGDQTELTISLGAGARCFFGTQSSTKIYRNPAARPCSHTTSATLAADSLLVFAPEPVQAFAHSRYTQRQEFRLAAGAGLALLDWFTSGRAARGERWAFEHLESRNQIFINGQRAVVDSMLLSSPEVPRRMDRFDCLATLFLVGQPLKIAAQTLLQNLASRPVAARAGQAFSVSPVQAGVLLRIAGQQVENVRRELREHLEFLAEWLGDNPWARKW